MRILIRHDSHGGAKVGRDAGDRMLLFEQFASHHANAHWCLNSNLYTPISCSYHFDDNVIANSDRFFRFSCENEHD